MFPDVVHLAIERVCVELVAWRANARAETYTQATLGRQEWLNRLRIGKQPVRCQLSARLNVVA